MQASDIRYLIALDDWPGIRSMALDGLKEYGPKAVGYLLQKFAPDSFKQWLSDTIIPEGK